MLIGEAAIVAAVKHELFRVGARPALGGGQDKPGSTISFPGGVAPRIELVGLPGSVAPLGEIARGSTALASQIMRTGKSTGVITGPPVTSRRRDSARRPRKNWPLSISGNLN
jgi:hypothetical protein